MITIPINAWSTFKSTVLDVKGLELQYAEMSDRYEIYAAEAGLFVWTICLLKDSGSDVTDFEDNYKASANQPVSTSVVTQFEAKNKTLKLFSASAAVNVVNGSATILAQIPGTFGSGDGRWINSGQAFFTVANAGDKIKSVKFLDHDNLLGLGVDYEVGSYTDDDAPAANQGWVIPPGFGFVKAETIGFYGFAPAGFYIQVIGQKAVGNYTGTLYVNFEWAKTE